jgi:hypothetical protein
MERPQADRLFVEALRAIEVGDGEANGAQARLTGLGQEPRMAPARLGSKGSVPRASRMPEKELFARM